MLRELWCCANLPSWTFCNITPILEPQRPDIPVYWSKMKPKSSLNTHLVLDLEAAWFTESILIVVDTLTQPSVPSIFPFFVTDYYCEYHVSLFDMCLNMGPASASYVTYTQISEMAASSFFVHYYTCFFYSAKNYFFWNQEPPFIHNLSHGHILYKFYRAIPCMILLTCGT